MTSSVDEIGSVNFKKKKINLRLFDFFMTISFFKKLFQVRNFSPRQNCLVSISSISEGKKLLKNKFLN